MPRDVTTGGQDAEPDDDRDQELAVRIRPQLSPDNAMAVRLQVSQEIVIDPAVPERPVANE